MFKRYGMFIAGVIFSALGISLITKAGLGTSPITSLAFVLTFIFPHTLGTFTMMVNSVMFIIQVILLGKAFQKIQLLQRLFVCRSKRLATNAMWKKQNWPQFLSRCVFFMSP